ncbi:unnamed protein product [Adineta steineri]|uniref:EGF-like domain-containing protein n=1 Tax=Adineta steineri TaxID=433720 RepID=A0A819J491_9BILA|nr:unnamed protein product [Adineta steineri]CAF3926527.1 unnamed protein product [Adineta steineri]
MSLLPMIINIPFRFVFFIILFHSPCSTMIMKNSVYDIDSCYTCTKISEQFVESYKKTAGSNFGGGNTDWEEKKLKGYAKSETRLIEIMENSCPKTESQCSTFLEKYEDEIEEWYRTSSSTEIDKFFQWLCIDTAKVCCPDGTFGKNCRRCQYGDNGRVCSGNGNCEGDGKRSGNGRCICETKYSGTNCSNCQSGYKKIITHNKDVICSDINECHSNFFLSPCVLRKCNNTEGAYECYGEPFYQELSKMTTLAVLLITISIFMYKEMYNLATLTCVITSVILVLFVHHIL